MYVPSTYPTRTRKCTRTKSVFSPEKAVERRTVIRTFPVPGQFQGFEILGVL